MPFDAEREINDLKKRMDDVEGGVGLILKQMHAVPHELSSLQNDANLRFDRVEGRLDGVESRLDGVEGNLDGTQRELRALRSELPNVIVSSLEKVLERRRPR